MSNLNLSFDPINISGILTAKFWVKGGSRLDPKNRKGIHQLLGSSLCRGCGPFNSNKVAELVEGYGAGLRCETYEDGLLISLKCSPNNAGELLPLIGWMILNPHLDIDQTNLERDLTIQTLLRQKENPFHIAFDNWRKLAYTKGFYSHDPLGEIKDLKKINQKELLSLSKELLFRQANMIITGNFEKGFEEEICSIDPYKTIIKSYNNNNNNNNNQVYFKGFNQNINKRNLIKSFEDTSQVILMIGNPTIPHGHLDDLPLRLLSCYLGSGMTSLLFRRLREKIGLAYDVGVYHPRRELESPFLIHASTSEDKSQLTLNTLLSIWEEISNNHISNSEMDLVRAKFRGQIAHSLQTSGQKAERKVHLRSLNLSDDYDKISLDKIKDIKSEDLLIVANKYLKGPKLSLCGPKKALLSLENKWRDVFAE